MRANQQGGRIVALALVGFAVYYLATHGRELLGAASRSTIEKIGELVGIPREELAGLTDEEAAADVWAEIKKKAGSGVWLAALGILAMGFGAGGLVAAAWVGVAYVAARSAGIIGGGGASSGGGETGECAGKPPGYTWYGTDGTWHICGS